MGYRLPSLPPTSAFGLVFAILSCGRTFIVSSSGGNNMAQGIFNLDGKVALVTGGSKGLGKAMARGLAEAGADIVISSRHENELRSALDEILQGTGRRGRLVVADMGKRDDVNRLARTALEQMRRIDILINNA